MITIESKTEFHRATTEQQRAVVKNSLMSPEVRFALVFAMSSMVENGATKEQLDGAKMYRTALLNLSEPEQKKPTFPEKKLQVLDT